MYNILSYLNLTVISVKAFYIILFMLAVLSLLLHGFSLIAGREWGLSSCGGILLGCFLLLKSTGSRAWHSSSFDT